MVYVPGFRELLVVDHMVVRAQRGNHVARQGGIDHVVARAMEDADRLAAKASVTVTSMAMMPELAFGDRKGNVITSPLI